MKKNSASQAKVNTNMNTTASKHTVSVNNNKTQVKKTAAVNKDVKQSVLKKFGNIEALPKTVKESIPFRGFTSDGIVETSEGVFTRSYKFDDIGFDIASDEEQESIFRNYMDILNSFDGNTRWQFTLFSHEIDKRKTLESIRVKPQKDGLNKLRQDLNTIHLNALKRGSNSVIQDKYLTISIEDTNAEHAMRELRKNDEMISQNFKKITHTSTNPLTTKERMKLLYNIYNQEGDYRFATSVMNGEEAFNYSHIEKMGIGIKDVIGPSSMEFHAHYFKIGDTFGKSYFLDHVPTQLSTRFLSDISDIQTNMLISLTNSSLPQEDAVKLVKGQIAEAESKAASIAERNSKHGYFGELPPELKRKVDGARELYDDVTTRNQNIFFLTMIVVIFAKDENQLEQQSKLLKSIAAKHVCPLRPLDFQHEAAFDMALPLCRDNLNDKDIMLTTENVAVFLPFNAKEICQDNAIYYGINRSTKSLLLYDRMSGPNYNGLIFGQPGSGKSLMAKMEIASVVLSRQKTQIFIIDPMGEYGPLVKSLKGEEIILAPGSSYFINPLDLNISEDTEDDVDPVTMKIDSIISLFNIIVGQGRELAPVHVSIIDRCVHRLYKPYLDELARTGQLFDKEKCPTLSDLYQELLMCEIDRDQSTQLAEILYQYAVGSFSTFAYRTNVETNAKIMSYNIKRLGTGMRELGFHVCLNDVWNKMMINSKKGIMTWFYIDEFHMLLESNNTTLMLKRIWKMARKWGGVPTGIMQNTEDLMHSADAKAIIDNTSFVIMFREPVDDRQNLSIMFNLSASQLEYITDSDPGCGLFYNGKTTVPFKFDISKNLNLYKLITTKVGEA